MQFFGPATICPHLMLICGGPGLGRGLLFLLIGLQAGARPEPVGAGPGLGRGSTRAGPRWPGPAFGLVRPRGWCEFAMK